MNCRDARQLLHGHLDAELGLSAEAELGEHLRACLRCRLEDSALRALRERLRAIPREAVPSRLRARLEGLYGYRQGEAAQPYRRMILIAGAAALLSSVSTVALLELSRRPAPAARGKVVYHISHSDTARSALRNITNHLDAAPDARIVVVAHNNGVDFLLRGARDESGHPFEPSVREFAARGVQFRVCNNTLVRRGVDAGQVLREARLVPSGIAEISRLQSEEGYAYLRL